MSKKIYDIMPPKVANKLEDTIKALAQKSSRKKRVVKETKTTRTTKKAPPTKKIRRFPLREIVFGGVVLILLLGIYCYNKLPRASIEISPNLNPITLNAKITADTAVSTVSASKKVIPLQLVEEIQQSSQEFPATGTTSNDGKATGTIRIYNKVSPATPLTLISGTHFLSDSGKYFVTLTKVAIPAMKGKTPGSVMVKIQAKEVGSEYNIGPSKFSVPKLSGTAYYYGIFAESTATMTGGYVGKVKKVTKDDLDSAEDVLTQQVLHSAENALKSKLSNEDVVLEGALERTVVESKSNAKADAIQDVFTQSVKINVRALVVKERDLETFAKNTIATQLTEGKKLLEDSLTISYSADSVDFAHNLEKISLQGEAKAYVENDFSGLANLLKGKNSDQIEDVIGAEYGETVSRVDIDFWPFWVKKAPKDKTRITINLKFK